MNDVEKAFTYRLYCPRKLVVKRAVDAAFRSAIVTRQKSCAKNRTVTSKIELLLWRRRSFCRLLALDV
jgi:hypothetical protein